MVLPFENLGRPEDAYFADGITEEITNRLTGIGGLKVIARSSAKQYKGTTKPLRQIGQELGVAYVLEGTVRWEKAGDSTSQVRVSPELIRVATGPTSGRTDTARSLSGVFQVQSDIAEQVAGAMNVALAAARAGGPGVAARPLNPQAYDYYLQGKNYFDRHGRTRWPRSSLLGRPLPQGAGAGSQVRPGVGQRSRRATTRCTGFSSIAARPDSLRSARPPSAR